MLNHILEDAPSFAFVISLGAFIIGLIVHNKFPYPIFNALLIGNIVAIVFLVVFKIDVAIFQKSASFLTYLLTPATVCLAVPVYKQVNILKKNISAILASCLAGMIGGLISVVVIALIFGMERITALSTLSRSITMAIAIDLTKLIGGDPSIVIAGVVFAGLFGTIISEYIFKLFRIDEPVAKGLALGASAHAIGTAEAVKQGDVEGAMASVAMVTSGIMMVGLVQVGALFIQ